MNDAHEWTTVPAPSVELTGGSADEATVLREFFTRLRKIPLSAWIDAAVPLADVRGDDDFESEPTAMARARLRAVVDRMPGGLTLAKSRVQDYAAVAEGFAPHGIVSRMKRVALTASLALIARPHLSRTEFERLYRPFEKLIPADELPRARG
jgi:hypothetical protein